MRLLSIAAALLAPMLLFGCDEEHPASLREAYFAYLDARAADGEPEEALAGLGWTVERLEEAVERMRGRDPEGFEALVNAYLASRGLPRDE